MRIGELLYIVDVILTEQTCTLEANPDVENESEIISFLMRSKRINQLLIFNPVQMLQLKETLKTLMIMIYPDYQRKRLKHFFNHLGFNKDGNEEKELLLLRYWLQSDSVFFDIGANNGLYTYVAQLYTRADNIYTFEPIPELSSRLKYMFSDARHFRLAFSDDKSTRSFKIPIIGGDEYKSRGTLNTTYKEKGETTTRLIDVTTDTLDGFCNKNNVNRLDFIKIDVEGHERKVIEGGTETLKTLRPVLQVEIEQRHHDDNILHIIEYIKKLGYHCHFLDLQIRQIVPLETNPQQIQQENQFKRVGYINNFIFLPDVPEWKDKLANINQQILKMC